MRRDRSRDHVESSNDTEQDENVDDGERQREQRRQQRDATSQDTDYYVGPAGRPPADECINRPQ